jgi:hypothetical protein
VTIPSSIDAGEGPGTLVAVLFTDGGTEMDRAILHYGKGNHDDRTHRDAATAATQHAIACAEGGGTVAIYDGDSGDLVALMGRWGLLAPL